MATSTTNYGLSKPAVNSATDSDIWGGEINADMDNIDGLMSTAINWIVTPATSTITVTAPTTGSITTGSAKYLYTCTATGGAFAANLPAVATATNMTVAFKKMDNSAYSVTITGHSSDNIDGANTLVLSSQYQYAVLVCDGTEWNIIASGGVSGGSVTSVTFTGDGTVLSSTPSSAVTSNGTLTATLNNQNANLVLAGPTSGGTGAPTYRSLVLADMPAGYFPLMTAGGVGSIVTARYTGGAMTQGGSYAGSNLIMAQFGSDSNGDVSGSLSGTWVALAPTTTSGDYNQLQRQA